MSVVHTPAPWFVPLEPAGSNGTQVWARGGDVRVANCDSGAVSLEGKRADARLISAAPDMLAALQSLLEASAEQLVIQKIDGGEIVHPAAAAARAAIAKATGAAA